jgi:hypothetical protein
MNHENMKSVSLLLPTGITFEVPREYARHCCGLPIRLREALESDDTFSIYWNDDIVGIENSGTLIEFDRESILGFVAIESEEILGMKVCMLRIGLIERSGNKTLLPILSASPQVKADFTDVVNTMRGLSLPVEIYESAQTMPDTV